MKKVNIEEIPWIERRSPKGHYHRFRRDVARAFEKKSSGPAFPSPAPFEVELVRMPPGAKNFPFHSHASEWEFYLIISGAGKMRAGKTTRTLKAGDCVMNPPGEPHQIHNTGKKDLVYYVIANNAPADVYHYPDSGKWGFSFAKKYFRLNETVYFDGEE